MFESLQPAPPDAILGLNESFRQDDHPQKINLTVGVYQDSEGRTPILQCVQRAEQLVQQRQSSKSYLGIAGDVDFAGHVRDLLWDGAVTAERCATVQTPGGTAALRVAADFLHQQFPQSRIWISQPTWANHPQVFAAAGVTTRPYRYLADDGKGLDFDGLLKSLDDAGPGDVVCLHACCHNPTGVDLSLDQWKTLAEQLPRRGLIPLLDFAYQGFGAGLDEDAAGMRIMAATGNDLLVCSSYSKNFGLYGERVGAMTIVAKDATAASAALSHIKRAVRTNYSNPPRHGAAIVATILDDEELRAQWLEELAQMRHRIHEMRQKFFVAMKARRDDVDFSFITDQLGMFSFSGLSPVQVDELKNKYSIYIVGSGRINVAGIQESSLDYLCDSIAAVL